MELSRKRIYRCYKCKKELPASEFYFRKDGSCTNECRACAKIRRAGRSTDIKGKAFKTADISMSEDDLKNYLYNQNKDIDYTIDDLLEEMQSNGEKGIRTVETTILIHKDMLEDSPDREKAMGLIDALSDKLKQLKQIIKE